MDGFDLKPERKKGSRNSLIWNFLTLLALLGICGQVFYFYTIFNDPNSILNPFPPAPLPTLYQTITPTSTIIPRAATWTPTATMQPSPSRTKAPTWTPLPGMITPSGTSPETTQTISPTPMPATAEITYQASTDFHPAENCNWLGVGGKVLNADGTTLQFQEILMGGTLDGKTISYFTLSGTASQYGKSGFELVLGDHPIASTQTLWIQLLDNTAKPLTGRIYVDTYDTCTQNLVMVVFTKNN